LNWLVDGSALNDKPRQGGTHALKGFTFQAGIALVRLTWLLTCRNGIVCLRYDGAQDIDVRFANGQEVYIQAKNYKQGNFNLQHLYKALAGFARDVISAKKADDDTGALSFHLMLTEIPTQDSAMELIRRKGQDVHAPAIVEKVAPQYRGEYSDDELLHIAKKLLDNTSYFISDIGDPSDTLQSIAGMELMKFGVLPEHIEQAMDILLQRLQAGASYYIEDVVEHIKSFVPAAHPAHPYGVVRLLPGKAHLSSFSTVRNDYFRGQPVIWEAIAHDLDVPRQELAAVEQDVLSHLNIGGMVVVAGPAGSGKSSLIYRAAWNLHHQGSVLAIHVKFPGKMTSAEWVHITRLFQLTKRPVLLVVDDVWRHTSFLSEFETRSSPGIVLLGSSRPAEFPGAATSYGIWRHDLGKLDASIAEQLARKMGVATRSAGEDFRGFLASGQILALSLHLQQTSLAALAANTLGSLSAEGARLYVDLCLGGMFDLPTPKSLMILRANAASVAWPEKSLQGLVFSRDGKNDLLQVGHALVASEMIEQARVNPVSRALELCALCTPGNSASQGYAIRLLRYVTRKYETLAVSYVDDIVRQAERLAVSAEFADSYQLEAMLKSMGAVDAATAIIGKTSFSEVRTVRDISLLISLTDSDNFNAAYPVLLAYYRKRVSLAGFKRFIYIVREHGSERELDELADLAVKWLSKSGLPPQETVATFDMLALGPKPVLRKYAQVVKTYIDRHGLKNQELALAAIRLAITARDEAIAGAVFDVAIEEARSGTLKQDQVVVHQIAKLVNTRLQGDAARREASYTMLRDAMPLNGSEIDHFLIRTLAHSTPLDKVAELQQTINGWPPVGLNKKQRRNLEHTRRLLERRSASARHS
jgi:hypothetical protein